MSKLEMIVCVLFVVGFTCHLFVVIDLHRMIKKFMCRSFGESHVSLGKNNASKEFKLDLPGDEERFFEQEIKRV